MRRVRSRIKKASSGTCFGGAYVRLRREAVAPSKKVLCGALIVGIWMQILEPSIGPIEQVPDLPVLPTFEYYNW